MSRKICQPVVFVFEDGKTWVALGDDSLPKNPDKLVRRIMFAEQCPFPKGCKVKNLHANVNDLPQPDTGTVASDTGNTQSATENIQDEP